MLSDEIGSHKISNADNPLPFWIYLKIKVVVVREITPRGVKSIMEQNLIS